MTDRNLNVNITTSGADRAAEQIGDVADEVREVEGAHRVDVDADATDAAAEVGQVRTALDGLTNEQRTVVLRAQAQQLETEIRRAERALGRVRDGEDVTVRLRAIDSASARLEEVRAELRDLDGDTARVNVEARGVDDLLDKLDAVPGRVGSAGAAMAAALSNPVTGAAALAGGLLLAGERAADAALQAGDLANLTGDSVEMASRLNAVWQRTGADVKDLQDVLLQMGGVLATDTELAAQLGVNIADGASLGERFVQVVGLLERRFDNVAERSLAASQLFGEEGVRQVNALLARVGDLDTALANVSDRQLFDSDDVAQANEYKAAMAELNAELIGFGNIAGRTVIPVVTEIFQTFNEGTAYAEELGRSIRGVFDGGAAQAARDYEQQVDTAISAGERLGQILQFSAESTDEVRAAAQRFGLSLVAQNAAVAEWGRLQREAAAAMDELAASAEPARQVIADPSWAEYVQTQRDLQAAMDGAPGTFAELEAAARRYAEGLGEAAGAQSELAGEFERLRDEYNQEATLRRIAGDLSRVEELSRAAAEAQAAGADDASAKWALADDALFRLQGTLLDYVAGLEDVPPSVFTQIRAQLDARQFDTVAQLLDELTADRFTRIVVQIDPTQATGFDSLTFSVGGGGRAPGVTNIAPAPVVNNNTVVYNPPGTPTTTRDNERVYYSRNGYR